MMKGQAHMAAPGPLEPPPAGEMHGSGGGDTSSTASPVHAAPPPQPPPQPPQPGGGPANLNGHAPQLSARGGAGAIRGNSWTTALPWSPVDGSGGPDPDGSSLLDSRDAVGGPPRFTTYGDDWAGGGGGGLFRQAGSPGERSYRAYHPESITLDVEGDIGDA
jgi:hypothetical protein